MPVQAAIKDSKFWQRYLASFAGSDEYIKVLQKRGEAQTKLLEDYWGGGKNEKFKKYTAEQLNYQKDPLPENVQKNIGAEMQDDLDHTGERWKQYNVEVARGVEEQAQFGAKQDEIQIKFGESIGAIGAHQAAMDMAAIHTKLYKDELADLDEQISRINQDKSLTPVQQQTQVLGVQNQKTKATDNYKIQSFEDAQAQLNTTWTGMIDSV